MFERLPTAPTSQELIDRAFRRSKKAGKGAKAPKREETMLMTAGNIIAGDLEKLVRKYPSFERIPPFYWELTEAVVGVDDMRIHLSKVSWASKEVKNLTQEHLKKIKKTKDRSPIRRAAFGRIASVVRSIDSDLVFLNEARKQLRKMPSVDPELLTIVVAGYPNVGKSSFLVAVTGARPEIADYPFTTKGIEVGHFIRDHKKYQVVDTPGLLDRPFSQRNDIELQAIAALRHLKGVLLYILDPSEHCGFSQDVQLALLDDVKRWIQLPVFVVANKVDLGRYDGADATMSTLTGDGVAEVLERLVELLDEADFVSEE